MPKSTKNPFADFPLVGGFPPSVAPDIQNGQDEGKYCARICDGKLFEAGSRSVVEVPQQDMKTCDADLKLLSHSKFRIVETA